jgi:hypothetical protein
VTEERPETSSLERLLTPSGDGNKHGQRFPAVNLHELEVPTLVPDIRVNEPLS